jgi:WD40 repeat protein
MRVHLYYESSVGNYKHLVLVVLYSERKDLRSIILQAHQDVVEDVAWHLKDENLFGSVGDDCKFMMWDLRTNKPEQSIVAHQKEVSML